MRITRRHAAALAALFTLLLPAPGMRAAQKPSQGEFFVYAGSYTRGKSKGIYVYRMDASGKLTPAGLAAETPNPSFLALHPSNRFLYSVSEISDFKGQKTGAVSAFALDGSTGKLTLLNTVASRGAGPCHLVVDKTGKTLAVANYGSGSTAAFPILADGRLGEAVGFAQHSGSGANQKRQQGPHAHSVNISPDNRFLAVADLGVDQVFIYRLDAGKAAITPNDPPSAKVHPGAGPRHFNFHPNGKLAYVINELQSTITGFHYDAARGALKEFQTSSTLPAGFSGESYTAEVLVHPSGRFLYGSNRGHDSIAVFSLDAAGAFQPVEHVATQGKTPRNFNIDPTGRFLIAANQNSDSIVVFRIDQKTGRLTPTGQSLEVGSPVCLKFVPVR